MKTWKTISKGVQQMPSGNYRVRKTIKGNKFYKFFTSKIKAISYYKTLNIK